LNNALYGRGSFSSLRRSNNEFEPKQGQKQFNHHQKIQKKKEFFHRRTGSAFLLNQYNRKNQIQVPSHQQNFRGSHQPFRKTMTSAFSRPQSISNRESLKGLFPPPTPDSRRHEETHQNLSNFNNQNFSSKKIFEKDFPIERETVTTQLEETKKMGFGKASLLNTKRTTEFDSFNLTASNHTKTGKSKTPEEQNIQKLSQKFKNLCKTKNSFEDIFIDEDAFQTLFDSKNYQRTTEQLLRFILHSSNTSKLSSSIKK